MDFGALDIGKQVIAFRLDFDARPRYLLREGIFLKLEPRQEDVYRCIRLFEGCCVGLEPTGNYSRIWIRHLQEAGIEIKLIRHDRLTPYRKNLDLPDKDDRADALALALYLKEHYNNPYRFIFGRDRDTEALRSKVLKLNSYARSRTRLISQIKSTLAFEFPKKLDYKSTPYKGNPPLLWRWMSGEEKSEKLDLEMRRDCGIGIGEDTKLLARHLCDYYRREFKIEAEITELLLSPQYARYVEVFELLRMGLRTRAIILSQIFPIEKYYNENGEPDREWRGKYWRDYSLRRFKKSIGIAPQQFQSGEGRAATAFSGSVLCRRALVMFVFSRVEVSKCRLDNPIFNQVTDYLIKLQQQKMPGKKRRFKVAAKVAEVIYFSLVTDSKSLKAPDFRQP